MVFKKNLIVTFLACLVFSGVLLNYLHRIPQRHYCDFRVYYKAGRDILHGRNIYIRDQQEVTPYKYSPFFAFVFSPLSLLPIKLAASVFLAINFVLTILLFYLSYHLALDLGVFKGFSGKTGFWIYALLLLCVFRYMFLVWEPGQVTIIMDSLVLLSLRALAKQRQALSGVFLAGAILIKYTPAILIPYFIFIRKPKIVLWTLISVLIFLMLPALMVGWLNNMTYLTSWIPSIITTSLDHGSYIDPRNQSLYSMILRVLSPTPYSYFTFLSFKQAMIVAYAVGLFFYALAFFHPRVAQRNSVLDFLLIIICTIIFNPNCWMANYMGLISSFAFLIQYSFANRFEDWVVSASLISAYFFMNIASKDLLGVDAENFGYIHSFTTIGALIIFAALVKIKFCAQGNPTRA